MSLPSYLLTARECVMAFMRVPSLEEEFGRDAAMCLNALGWGKELLGRALGRDADGRLVRTASSTITRTFFLFRQECLRDNDVPWCLPWHRESSSRV